MRALVVAFADAEQAIHVPADLAAAAEERFAPLHRIVIPFALVFVEPVTCDGIKDSPGEIFLHVAGDHPDLPGLDIAAAGAAAGDGEKFLYRGALERRRQKTAHPFPGA